jgi:putative addiction module CopG family antidote
MTIHLTDHYIVFIEQEIQSGKYKDASDVIQAGLALLQKEHSKKSN